MLVLAIEVHWESEVIMETLAGGGIGMGAVPRSRPRMGDSGRVVGIGEGADSKDGEVKTMDILFSSFSSFVTPSCSGSLSTAELSCA